MKVLMNSFEGGQETVTARRSQSVAPPQVPQRAQAPQQTGVPQRASTYEEARRELTEQLIIQGVEPKRADIVAEATIRRAKAREGHTVFHYADVEEEFEERCRRLCADPRRIDATKRRVWTAARATAETHGLALEEALFFCYHEGLEVHREFLVAVAPDEEPADEKTPAADAAE